MSFVEDTTITNHDGFFTALNTFLVTTDGSWTQDDLDLPNDEAAWHKTSPSSVFVSFRWDNTNNFSCHQALGFTGGNSPGFHPDDSGNGDDTGAITAERRVSGIGAGPFTKVTFMSDSTASNGTWVNIIIEHSPGEYRHINFGLIDKRGMWTGGAYLCGNHWDASASNNDSPLDTRHTIAWEARHTLANNEVPTMHVEGLTGQAGASKWGIMWGSDAATGNDTAGNPRETLLGGVRDGPNATLTFTPATDFNGFVAFVEIPIFHRELSTSPDEWRLLGYAPDARILNMRNFTPGQEETIGADTYKIFPWIRKRFLQDNQDESHNAGIAYKKVT